MEGREQPHLAKNIILVIKLRPAPLIRPNAWGEEVHSLQIFLFNNCLYFERAGNYSESP
ncbi:Uncharacterized protein dnm_062590 [Desulfonema magnum]|uniref:Uncharacterized protein n=1 Tax=Desulfonema magnum TaxID=45655 RepID=A0A975BRR9_9BACT|nr:Uncharacterized protein dnm_062590 [Desulfonema magnum]